MKDLYTKPELELDEFKLVDVMTSSTEQGGSDGTDSGDEW